MMGGNLFKVERVSKEKYLEILDTLYPVLDKYFGNNYRIPKPYHNKPTYGDVDVILNATVISRNTPNWQEKWLNPLLKDLGNPTMKQVRNVISLNYMNFQVDFFMEGESKFETSYNFMCYNILGNLLGRIFHKFNLRYGEDGLAYVLRGFNNHVSKEIVICKNLETILGFIGLSYERWLHGFDELEDIFKYVIDCKYFCSNSYNPEYFNIQKRATERPDFNKFLDYLETNKIEKNYPFEKDKLKYLPEIDSYFGSDLKEKVEIHMQQQQIAYDISQKFNGKIVMELLNIEGKELGSFIHGFKEWQDHHFESFILENDQDTINKAILMFFDIKRLIDTSK